MVMNAVVVVGGKGDNSVAVESKRHPLDNKGVLSIAQLYYWLCSLAMNR